MICGTTSRFVNSANGSSMTWFHLSAPLNGGLCAKRSDTFSHGFGYEGALWLAHLYASWETSALFPVGSGADRIAHGLVGTAAHHAVGVRRLVRSGLDFSARIVLRSLQETMFLAILMHASKELRTEYHAAQDPEDARAFWFKRLSRREIGRRLDDVEVSLGFDAESRHAFAEYRRVR